MEAPAQIIDPNNWNFLDLDPAFYDAIKGTELSEAIVTPHPSFQIGGESMAWKYLQSFLKDRYRNYSKHISKPSLSRRGCSRISPLPRLRQPQHADGLSVYHGVLSPSKEQKSTFQFYFAVALALPFHPKVWHERCDTLKTSTVMDSLRRKNGIFWLGKTVRQVSRLWMLACVALWPRAI